MALQLLEEAFKDCNPKVRDETFQLLWQSATRLWYCGASEEFVQDLASKIEMKTIVGAELGLDIIILLLMPDSSRDEMYPMIQSVAQRLSEV